MKIGDLVTWRGRPCYLRGIDPMSVDDRRAELEDARSGEQISVPLHEVEEVEGPKLGEEGLR